MCTVSILERAGALRLVANRDEQRTRARAVPPAIVDINGMRVLMPIDPVSGGTWIAGNAAGLAIALLNVNPPGSPLAAPPRSRGEIVPKLAGCSSLSKMAKIAASIDPRDYAPFRLVCAAFGIVLEIVPSTRSIQRLSTRVPRMFTSSGLGDEEVEAPRRELFNQIVCEARVTDQDVRQDQFHSHQWPERPHLSVWMSREDACTVSRTVVEIGEGSVNMTYSAAPAWEEVSVDLAR
jgi:hypothetical protein